MRFLVLGAGAIGGFFGGKLLKGGADVTFLVRPGRAAQLERDGLVVRAQDGEFRARVRTLRQGEVDGAYDVVLLACKAYDLPDALYAIAPAMEPQSVVLPFLNGVSHIDRLVERFGAACVLGGLTIINPMMLPDGTIQQSAVRINITAIGELAGGGSPRCSAIQQALAAGGIPTEIRDDIRRGMWDKLYGFACNAAITSLTRSRAGAIAETKTGARFVSDVLDEAARILAAEGYPVPGDIREIIRGMFAQTGSAYAPSLFVDMEQGRPTEGEHTIGDLVRRAVERGVAAPVLTAALCNLQAYELKRAQPQPAA